MIQETNLQKIYELYKQTSAVTIDSRKIGNNSIFFALKGDNFNGNKFAKDAISKGSLYAIVDEAEQADNEHIFYVKDSLKALQELANYHRKQFQIPVLAITGTNGKTTTKELISAVIEKKYNLIYTQGNLNNHIGVPLTLLRMRENTDFAVIEMGANHPGEIDELCKIAQPTHGLITNIGKAHLEGFGSLEGVIKTKSELYAHLIKNSGTVFYNSDNSILSKLEKPKNIISYGTKDNASVLGQLVQSQPCPVVRWISDKNQDAASQWKDTQKLIQSNLVGKYNFENILAAITIGHYFSVETVKIKEAIENFKPKNNRSQLIKQGFNTIIMDAYNANPTSMHLALENFNENPSENKLLILGEMLELGAESKQEHAKLLKYAKELGFKQIYLIGSSFHHLKNDFSEYKYFDDAAEFCSSLSLNPISHATILLKGSRGNKLEGVLPFL